MSVLLNKPRKKKGKAFSSLISGLISAVGCGVFSSINTYIAAIALLICLISFFVFFISFKRLCNKTDLEKALLSLPENYYCINNVKINSSNIDYVVICPKGIFNIESYSFNMIYNNSYQFRQEKYIPIKRSILDSKALNDFMQKCKIGNFFVNTLLISNFEDDKLKTYFPDIPIIKHNEINTYFKSLTDKYSDTQCKKTADLLDLNLRIDKNMKQLREGKNMNENQGRKANRSSQ